MRGNKLKRVLITLVMSLMIFGNTLTVFAAEKGGNDTIAEYISENGNKLGGSVKGNFKTGKDVNAYDDTYVYYTYEDNDGNKTYYFIKKSDESSVQSTISKIKESGDKRNVNNSVFDGNTDQWVADVSTASGLLTGFVGPITTLLGILVVFVTVGMTVFTAFDLSYIAFPIFREKCDEKKATGGPGTKQGKDGTTKLLFVSDDAQHAVIAADTVQSGKSPFVIYLKTRMLSYILLAIVIFIMLTGNIGIFANLALKLVQGILDFLDSFQ